MNENSRKTPIYETELPWDFEPPVVTVYHEWKSGEELMKWCNLTKMRDRALYRLLELYGHEFKYRTCYDVEDGTGYQFFDKDNGFIYNPDNRYLYHEVYSMFHATGRQFQDWNITQIEQFFGHNNN